MRTLAGVVGLLLVTLLASPGGAMAMPATGAALSIASDKADYAPGELVTLTGASWQAGESVHIRVNDDAGSTWSRDVDVTADADGAIADRFNLPESFIAQYRVTATGASSGGVATTTFTDGNLRITVGGVGVPGAQVIETVYDAVGCTGNIKNTYPKTDTDGADNVGVGTSESIRLVAAATANAPEANKAFANWTGPGLSFTVDPGTNGRSVCVAGPAVNNLVITANYAGNVAPTVAANNGSVAVNEGANATNTGTFSDANGGDNVTISASRGSVTKTGTNSGMWSWSFTTSDGPEQTGPVTVTADDGHGGVTTTTFTLNVNNVAPTVTLAAANPLSVYEGSTQQTYSYTISDPGADTVSGVTTSCGANGSKVAGSDTNTNTSGSFKCTFPDGTNTSVVSASATDSDNATGNLATQSVTVDNVAPTVSLTGPATADEGQTKTYTFTVSDPGQDTFSSDAGFPDCDAGATNNGTFVAGTLSVSASGGSFQCFFANGPSSANVKIQVRDSDGAGNGASQSVQVVAVANVSPSVTAPANQSANEGASTSFNLGSFSDPGLDSPWSVDVDWGDGTSHDTFDMTATETLGSLNHTYADGASARTVTVAVTDKNSGVGTATFTVAVANVAPAVTLSSSNDLSVLEGSTHTYSYSISDPGSDTVASVAASCGAEGSKSGDTHTDVGGSFKCTFPDGPADSTVSVAATDSDGGAGAAAEQVVHVANVAPIVQLSGAADVLEGSTHGYAFTVSDPGVDGFERAAGFPDCDAGASDNGSLVAGSYDVTAMAGSFDCFFADGPATANVKIKVADSDGASGTDSESVQVVNVANVAPSVTAPADQAGDEGAAISVDLGSFTDPGPDSPWAVDVDWGDASTHAAFDMTLTGTLGTERHTYADSGTYTVSVKVSDNHGDSDTKTFEVAVANVAPTVTFSSSNDLSVFEGSTHTYGYSISDPGSDTVTSVAASCGAEGTKSEATHTDVGGSFKCTFPDGPADSTVSVAATDSDDDAGAAAEQVVAVANVAPTVNLSGSATADEGSTKTYAFTVSDPGMDEFERAAGFPDCDAGASDNGSLVTGSYDVTATGGSFDCFFADGPATANVKIRVADSDGASGTDSESVQVVNVANVAPSVTAPADQAGDEGAAISVDLGSFIDPGPDSPWAVDVNWGDGSTPASFNATSTGSLGSRSHTYAANGNYTVSVKVGDNHGDSDTKTFNVKVANVPPSLTAPADQTAAEGAAKAFDLGAFTEPNPADGPWAVDVAWGDGSTHTTFDAIGMGSLGSRSHTYADNGTYIVSISVTDKSGGTGSKTFEVAVANVAPTITSFTGTNSLAGPLTFAPSTFKTDFTDPGKQDSHSAAFTWSNGSPSSQTVSPFVTGQKVDHTFGAGCNRTATVKVTDNFGDFDTKTASVNVGTGSWLPPLADQPVSDKLKNGQVLPVKVKIADCSGVPVPNLAPVIQLVKGDLTAVNDDSAETIAISSVSAADTGTTMRAVDGAYIYNLKVSVASGDLGKDHTIIVYPYGTGTPQTTLRHVIVPIK